MRSGAILDVARANAFCRNLGYNQQALYCYGKMYHLDPTNVNALWDRASLAKEIGDLKTVSLFALCTHFLGLNMSRLARRCSPC